MIWPWCDVDFSGIFFSNERFHRRPAVGGLQLTRYNALAASASRDRFVPCSPNSGAVVWGAIGFLLALKFFGGNNLAKYGRTFSRGDDGALA